MAVRRIVANIAVETPAEARAFYGDLLGLDLVMDLGWIATFGSEATAPVQVSVAREGGAGTAVPALSIEVDDIEDTHRRATAAGFEIVYPLTEEPWGVRRFFVRDPFGNTVNILAHLE